MLRLIRSERELLVELLDELLERPRSELSRLVRVVVVEVVVMASAANVRMAGASHREAARRRAVTRSGRNFEDEGRERMVSDLWFAVLSASSAAGCLPM